MWGLRRDLHELDAVAVGIGDPILPVVIHALRRFAEAFERHATRYQLPQCGIDIIHRERDVVIAVARAPLELLRNIQREPARARSHIGRGALWRSHREQLYEGSWRHLNVDDPGRRHAFSIEAECFAESKLVAVEVERAIEIRYAESQMSDTSYHELLPYARLG